MDVITTGKFELLLRDDPNIFAYKRISAEEKLIVLCNFSAGHVDIKNSEILSQIKNASIVITNEKRKKDRNRLNPYESVVYSI